MRKEVVVAIVTSAATIVVAAVMLRQRRQRGEWQWKQRRRILRKFGRDCAAPVPKLWEVADALVSDMQFSLANTSSNTSGSTSLNTLVSYLASLPNGNEEGTYYGVNFRGTSFLILCARFGGKNEPVSNLSREEISIPSNVIKSQNSQDLFEFIAMEVAKFVETHPDSTSDDTTATASKKLGFTVSCPVDQASTSLGNAITWKSCSADDPVGKELVNGLNQALKKHGVHLLVVAMVDETVGDLAGGRYYNKDTIAAVTLGMGTNAAYIEPKPISSEQNDVPSIQSDEMVISTQWGDFCSSHLPITEFDASLDAESSNPRNGIYEKLISEVHLGEIVRKVLLKMAQETSLFGDFVPPKLRTPHILRTPVMATMHHDTSEDRDEVGEKLKETFGIMSSTPMVRDIVVEVCDIVSERGARLAGAGIVGIIKKLGRIENKRSVVTVEGGLFEHYRIFRNYLNGCIWEMLGNDHSDNVVIDHSHGGSGIGAIFLAAAQSYHSKS